MAGALVQIEFEGKTYRSRTQLARHLAETVGRTAFACYSALSLYNDDAQKVIDRYKEVDAQGHEYVGTRYRTRAHLARYLTHLTGRSFQGCLAALALYNDDAQKVIDRYKEVDARARVTVNGRAYKNKAAYFQHLAKYYRIAATTAQTWHAKPLNLSLEQIETRAKERAKRNPREPRSGEIAIFGWRFRSLTAACNYYRSLGRDRNLTTRWHAHIDAGKPAHEFFLPALARLWEAGGLDERNRFPPEVEARLPRRMLPLNTAMEAVTDEDERFYIDVLQPPEVETLRRLSLRTLARWKERAA
jgi:hypothetical protein